MTDQETYPRFFNAQDLGQSLKEVSAELLHAGEADITSRWFHSSKDADLFVWLDKKKNILKQQLSFYGQVIEWNVVEGLKTGHILIDDSRERSRGSEIVRFDQKPQTASVDQAIDLLRHVTALKEEERSALIDSFSKNVSFTNMEAQDFVTRFGSFLERPKAVKPHVSFWRRLFRF